MNWDLESDRSDEEDLVLRVLGGQPDQPPPPLPAQSLDEHIRSRGLSLQKRRPILSDGNCWWDCIDDLMEIHPIPGVPRGHLNIRKYICDRVMSLPAALINDWIQIHFKNRVSAFGSFLNKLKRSGTYTDDFGIITLATSLILGNNF